MTAGTSAERPDQLPEIVGHALYSHYIRSWATKKGGVVHSYTFSGGRIYWCEKDRGWRYELWSTYDGYVEFMDLVGSGNLETVGDLQRVIDHAISESTNPSAIPEEE